jgi:Ca2+/Na+ antiporter
MIERGDGDEGKAWTQLPAGTLVMHFITVPWKVVFAVCPPTVHYNGWATFVVALLMIGIVTGFIGDLAGLFGCAIGMPDSVTAITFVALGTSLPDTFASMAAAQADDSADAAIGNVTGSNAVNVFLGLGLPWLMASCFWDFGSPDQAAKEEWVLKYAAEYVRAIERKNILDFCFSSSSLQMNLRTLLFLSLRAHNSLALLTLSLSLSLASVRLSTSSTSRAT